MGCTVHGMKHRFFIGISCVVTLAACQAAPGDDGAPSFEEFEARATRVVDGRTIYVVEGDTPLTRAQLLEYYRDVVLGSTKGLGTVESQLTVNLFIGADDIWPQVQRFSLRYCVSNEFGTLKTRAVAEMAAAAAAWERVADVNFDYDPAQDGTCNDANPNITFAVRPWTEGGSCAFFPSGGGCLFRTVAIDYHDFDTNPEWHTLAPNLTTGGILIHELGHTLGFRHEHIRFPGGCLEDTSWRGLTEYDPGSTMHYPWCPGGVMTSNFQLTSHDGEGAAIAYGWHTNMNDIDRRVVPDPEGDFWDVSDMAQSFRAPFAVTIRHIDVCAYPEFGSIVPTQVTLRAGDDINGPVLATSTQIFNTGEPCGWGLTFTRATFPDTALAAGASYTARFSNGNQTMGLLVVLDRYSGGAAWTTYQGGTRQDIWDLIIRVVRPPF
jgi:hypothetical protein